MATIELTNIVDRGVFIKIGKAGKGVAYQLTNVSIIEGCPWHTLFILTTNLSGGGFYYAITSLSLEKILGKNI